VTGIAALPRSLRTALTLALALGAAVLCEFLRTPLPWLIGPLLVTAVGNMAGAPLVAPRWMRNAGQWAIGCALGLYFTPEVVQLVLTLAPALVAGIVWALLIGYGFYLFLWRSIRHDPGADRATAYFAAAIGGASEMAVQGEKHGARVDQVAAAHSLRVLMVVMIIPFGFQAAGLRGLDAVAPALHAVHLPGLALLLALTLAGAFVIHRIGLPNPWVLGALAVAMLLTANGIVLSALPTWLTNGGQLFIGVALGSRFTPDFLHSAPRWLAAVAIGTLVMIVISAGFAWVMAQFTHLHPATLLLATSPGGIAEMCITAKVLQLGAPVVTAFHVVRYLAVLLLTAPLFRWRERIRLQQGGDA
jgi:membrane AbrB-like protein